MTFEQWCERFRDKLSGSGQRLTHQRRTIARVLYDREGHLNVDELHRQVRDVDAAIGYATVYRTLKLLEHHEMVRSHTFVDGTARYEVTEGGDEHHDHLVCGDCGEIIEFENAEIERLQKMVAAELGFSLDTHRMVLFGRCRRVNCPHRR